MPSSASKSQHTSQLIPGVPRREVAKRMGLKESEVAAIELKFRLRLRQHLAADPETAHLLTILPKSKP